ncbi:MAG: hypothetical protein ACI8RD_009956 [Bacillariaceae sp.]|jgi:hypothetical protein
MMVLIVDLVKFLIIIMVLTTMLIVKILHRLLIMDTRGLATSVPIPLILGNSAHLLPLAAGINLLCLRNRSNIHLLMGMLVVHMISIRSVNLMFEGYVYM